MSSIEGYASPSSVTHGSSIDFCISKSSCEALLSPGLCNPLNHDFKDKHLWIKKATGLGVILFVEGITPFTLLYHWACLPSKKNPPVGPLSGNVAAHTIPFAPSSTGRPPLPPISVATHPGSTELTKMPVPAGSSAARIRVNALRAALEMLYAGGVPVPPPPM